MKNYREESGLKLCANCKHLEGYFEIYDFHCLKEELPGGKYSEDLTDIILTGTCDNWEILE